MRRAIVTGGVSGLGEACAMRLREDGVEVITVDLSDRADYSLDVSDSAAVDAAVAAIGRVDILINSAGITGPNKPLWEVNCVAAAHRHVACDIWPVTVIPVASNTAVLKLNALSVPARCLRIAIRRTQRPATSIVNAPTRNAARLDWPTRSAATSSRMRLTPAGAQPIVTPCILLP